MQTQTDSVGELIKTSHLLVLRTNGLAEKQTTRLDQNSPELI